MTHKRINYQSTLFFITILFFIIGLVHISLAAIGFVCFIIPLVMYAVSKERTWCKYYCPRAGLFTRLLRKISLQRPIPKFLTQKRMKNGVLIYFGINLFFVMMSTIMVSIGRIAPLEQLRFLILFPLPIQLPQLLDWQVAGPLVHFGYRIYSVMFTSTLIGLLLGLIYKPRTWCIICPIQNLTTPKGPKINSVR